MADGTLVSSGSSGSMPTGSGSERLCRASIHELNAGWQEMLSGTAGHIYTIISLIFCEQAGTAGIISCRVNVGSGSYDIKLFADPTYVHSKGTFVFSDRFVIEEDDDLDVYNASSNGDWYVSYIDQNWT